VAVVGALSLAIGVGGAAIVVSALLRLRSSPDQSARTVVAVVLGLALVGFASLAVMGVVQVALA